MLAEWGEGGGGVGAVHRLPDVGRPPRPRLSTGLPGFSAGCRPEQAAVTWDQELDAEEVSCCERGWCTLRLEIWSEKEQESD